MSKTLWVHPFNGVSGDMMLGALFDAGADLATVRDALDSLPFDGWSLDLEEVDRDGVAATNAVVATRETHVARSAADIIAMLDGSALPERVVQRSTAVFRTLAEAEGAVHRQDPADVHFHEVGGADAIVDVVGTCAALESLEVAELVVGPIALGHGAVSAAHGMLPNPAPATIRLLEGWPVVGLNTTLEVTTPTGAALLTALGRPGPVPSMTIDTSGFGAGDARPGDFPNILHVILGTAAAGSIDRLVMLETNVDDVTGEVLGHTIERLMAVGSLDAWVTPITMKRGRPAHTVSALAEPRDAVAISEVLADETGSLGVRSHPVDRAARPRETNLVVVDGHEIRVKVSPARTKAEHRDVVAAAEALGRPVRVIASEAESLWRAQHSSDVT